MSGNVRSTQANAIRGENDYEALTTLFTRLFAREHGSLWPEDEPDLLIDELQRVSALIVGSLVDHSNRQHFFEEILPARIGHRAYPESERIARINDAMLFQLPDREGDLIVGYVRVLRLDYRIRLCVVAVEIVVPADCGGVDKALHEIRVFLDEVAASLDQGRIGRVAIVREEEDVGLEAALFLDFVWLGGDIALLD